MGSVEAIYVLLIGGECEVNDQNQDITIANVSHFPGKVVTAFNHWRI